MSVSFISADSWKKKKKNPTHHFKEPGDNGPCDIHVDDGKSIGTTIIFRLTQSF